MTLQEKLGILSSRLQVENEERKKSHVTFEDEEKRTPPPRRARPVMAPLSFPGQGFEGAGNAVKTGSFESICEISIFVFFLSLLYRGPEA